MNNFERKQNEMAYICDEQCASQMLENSKKVYKYNHTEPWKKDELSIQIRNIFGKSGENCIVTPPFYCDYGYNIEVGNNFYSNYNLTILDVAKVKIGDNVFIAPSVSIYTAGHPIHPKPRNAMYEYGISVTIGSDCWIGGNTVICPGVSIGEGTVIGAGSVVTKDIPANVIAVGNPCKVIRKITDDDKQYYFKKRKFDNEIAPF